MKPSFRDFDPTKFKNELTKINCKNKLQIEKKNPHLSLRRFLKTIEELFNGQCPIKKVSQKISYKQKPWITVGLTNSINKYIYVYIYIYLYKERYFKTFFEENKKDSKKVWKLLMQSLIITKTHKNHDK